MKILETPVENSSPLWFSKSLTQPQHAAIQSTDRFTPGELVGDSGKEWMLVPITWQVVGAAVLLIGVAASLIAGHLLRTLGMTAALANNDTGPPESFQS